MQRGGGGEHLGLASDAVPLEVAIFHTRKRPEDVRHHIFCSALQGRAQHSTRPMLAYLLTQLAQQVTADACHQNQFVSKAVCCSKFGRPRQLCPACTTAIKAYSQLCG